MGYFTGIAKPGYEAVVKTMREMIQSGIKPLYRHSNNPGRLFEEDLFKTYLHQTPKVNTAKEPVGLYFAKNIPDINPLLSPGEERYVLSDILRTFASRGDRPTLPQLKESGMPEGLARKYLSIAPKYDEFNRGMMVGVVPPEVKQRSFKPDEWEDYITELASETPFWKDYIKKINRNTGTRGFTLRPPNPDMYGGPSSMAKPREFATKLTERLVDEGTEVVTFPDTVAKQPNIEQTVLLTRDNMLAKWRKGNETGAGVLGVAGLAAPKFFGWEQGKEQE